MRRAFKPAIVSAVILLPQSALAQDTQEERDVGFIQGLIEDNLSGAGRTVIIEGFEGALSSRATIDEMTIADDEGIWFRAEGLVLDWDRSALLGGRIDISEMSADLLHMVRPPNTEEEPVTAEATPFEFALPDLPVGVSVDQIEAEQIILGAPLLGEELVFSLNGTVALSGGEGSANIVAQRLEGPAGLFEINGSYSNDSRILGLNVRLAEDEGGLTSRILGLPDDPSVALTLEGTGPIDDYTANLSIATAEVERIAGTFGFVIQDGAQDLRLDVRGDVNALIETDYAEFFGPDVRLAFQGGRNAEGALSLTALELNARALDLTGSGRIGADGWPETLNLSGQVASRDGSDVQLPVGGGDTFVQRADIEFTFDAASGDQWTTRFDARDFAQPGLSLSNLVLSGGGTISQGSDTVESAVTGDLRYEARGLVLADAALAEALGADISGQLTFAQQGDAPFDISALTLTGPGIEISAEAQIDTSDGVIVDTNLDLDARNLARFGALTGLDLNGAAEASVAGRILPLDGIFDVVIDGETTDLAIGIDALDPLIGGTGDLILAAARDTEGTRLERLSLTTPEVELTARADIQSARTDATFDLTIRDIALSVPELSGTARLSGTAALAGDASGTVVTELRMPGTTADITALLASPAVGGAVTLDVAAEVADLAPYSDIAGLDLGGSTTLAINGTAARDGSAADLDLVLGTNDLAIGIPQADRLLRGTGSLTSTLIRDGEEMRLDDLTLRTPALSLLSDVALTNGDVAADLNLTLRNVADVVDGLSGAATLAGTVERSADGVINADLDATGPGEAVLDLLATLSGDTEGQPLTAQLNATVADLGAYSALAGQTLGGSVDADITVDVASVAELMSNPIAANFSLTARDLRLAERSLPGRLTLNGTAERTGDGTLSADARINGPGEATIRLTNGSLSADGNAAGEFAAAIADLRPYSSVAGQSLAGSLGINAGGTLRTDLSVFDAEFDVEGQNLSVGGTALSGGIDLTGSALRQQDGFTDLAVSGTAPGNADLTLTARGTDGLQADLDLRVETLAAYAGLAGRPLSGAVDVQVEGTVSPGDFAFDLGVSGQTSNLNVGVDAVTDLLRGTGTINGQIRRDASGALFARNLDVAYPNIQAQADLTQRDGGTDGTFSARLADVGLFTDELSGPASAQGNASILPSGGTRLDIAATGPGGTRADVAGSIAANGNLALTINGAAPLGLANGFIEPRRLSGDATFDLAVNGPPALSSVNGTIRLANGRLAAPNFNQALEDINGSVRLTGQNAQLDIGANLEAGGRITISGPVELGGSLNAGLRVAAQGLVLRDPSLYETTADALITVNGPLSGGALISGNVEIGPTEVQVPSSTASALGPLPQVTHIGAPSDVRRTLDRAGLSISGVEVSSSGGSSTPLGLDILVNAPSRIFIRGRGLDAELGGQLRITGDTNQIIPIGQFELIRGRIDILQQRFQLDEGGAFLQGSFDPFVRLVASTEARDGTEVRIIVDGPATAPEVRFESSPDLPQDEVLARLIFGRDLSSISPVQAVQLAAAVSTLAGNSSGGLLDSFRQNTGLDDFDITTDEDGNAAVRAGAYISENVYTDVTVGTENTEINLNLDLTDDITVTGSTGTNGDTSIGIFFERDY